MASIKNLVSLKSIIHMLALLTLLLTFGREAHSALETSLTYDEYIYIARGYTYVRTGDTRLKLRHPILVDALATLPLLLLPDIQLPLESAGWLEGNFHRYAPAFMWEANTAIADKIAFLSRLPIMWLSLILAAGVFRWAREYAGGGGALLALVLCAFDPNILAHGRLVTPDVGQTTFIFLAAFAWWRYMVRPGWSRWLISGVTLGLAQASGFPALILIPIFGLSVIGYSIYHSKIERVVGMGIALLGVIALGGLVLWGVYAFDWGPIAGLGMSFFAPYHWEEFIDLLSRLRREDLAYFWGEVYRGGRPAFFIVALLIKTPIATLGLWALGLLWVGKRRACWLRDIVLWSLPLLYYGNALRSNLNIGYRHILPILPFLFVMAGQAIHILHKPWHKVGIGILAGWLMVSSLSIHPSYLAYFNEFVGGPLQGRKYFAVSDLDWGQGLPRLRDYLLEREIEEVYLSWFGTTPPEYYGIHYKPLPSWPPPEHPERVWFHPEFPLPGTYVISAANLVGARLEDRDTFRWFWQMPYQDHVGYSLFVYQVPHLLDPDAEPVNIALSGTSLDALPAHIVETQFRTNDMHPRWFDARRALIFPRNRAFFAIGADTPLDEALRERFLPAGDPVTFEQFPEGDRVALYEWENRDYVADATQKRALISSELIPEMDAQQVISLPVMVGDSLTLLGYEWEAAGQCQGGVEILTFWCVEKELSGVPWAIFFHVLAPDGTIVDQEDRLDVVTRGLLPGDIFVQIHRVSIPSELSAEDLWVQLGLYRQDTMDRLGVELASKDDVIGDRILLGTLQSVCVGE
jgi:4-amino-4-deoxy-L-arabinose transferase-like glycosyltransferase